MLVRRVDGAADARLSESSDEPEGETGPAKIGQTFTHEDGLKVSVLSAKKDTAGLVPDRGQPWRPHRHHHRQDHQRNREEVRSR